jgi:hypothetical protein
MVLLLIALSPKCLARTAVAAGPTVVTGSLGGAAYQIEMPTRWNGTLILWSHGYIAPGPPIRPSHSTRWRGPGCLHWLGEQQTRILCAL